MKKKVHFFCGDVASEAAERPILAHNSVAFKYLRRERVGGVN